MNKNLILITVLILLTNCSYLNKTLLPLKNIPKPSGPYQIGTMIFEWEDLRREEWFTKEKGDFRRLIVQFWYPSIDTDPPKKNPYLDYPEERAKPISDQIGIPSALMTHLDVVNKNSIQNVPISKHKNNFPLIVFSHGLGGMRMQNTIQCEELASRGYVVVAMDHAFDAHATFFKDKTFADFRSGIEGKVTPQQFWEIRTPQLETRAADISFVLDQITNHKINGRNDFYQSIKTENVGVFGHSFGGATAIMASISDDRIKACINLDGWIVPVPEMVVKSGLKKPFLYIGQESWKDTLNYSKLDRLVQNTKSSKKIIILEHTKHYDFTDIAQIAPVASRLGITGSMNNLDLKKKLNEEVIIFFDQFIKGEKVKTR